MPARKSEPTDPRAHFHDVCGLRWDFKFGKKLRLGSREAVEQWGAWPWPKVPQTGELPDPLLCFLGEGRIDHILTGGGGLHRTQRRNPFVAVWSAIAMRTQKANTIQISTLWCAVCRLLVYGLSVVNLKILLGMER